MQEDAVEVSKAEKQRLKQQQQHKKQLIEKMREEQNAMAEDGEVSRRMLLMQQQHGPMQQSKVYAWVTAQDSHHQRQCLLC